MVELSYGGARPDRARGGLVLLHGRGATAEGILDLGHALGLPDLALAAPQAPGMTWWPTSFLAPSAQMEPFVERGLAAVDAAIAALVEQGLPRDRIALAGFSQGGCLALEYAARRGGLTAVFGLSAGLVGTGDAGGGPEEALYGFGQKRFDYDTRLDGVPVEITVHERDPHIPLARARESEGVFARLGAAARLTVTPGAGHGIGPEAVAALRGHLNV
ncbi:alpha/beta hydrolase [Roseicyclus sp.]|uniref:alpha/beta hydrolase n=1 Tax=Roseicyclus sp. TaxID=1914329 RepID=UPI003F9FBE09